MASKLCLGWPVANISMPCYCPREWPLHKIEVNCRLIETFVQTPLFPTTRAASSPLAQFSNMGPWTWKWNSCDGNDRPILRPIKQFKFSFSPLLRALQKILCMYWTKKGKLQPKRLVKIYIRVSMHQIIFICKNHTGKLYDKSVVVRFRNMKREFLIEPLWFV